MTRYDPFSYGQVRLGEQEPSDAKEPDDILFAGGEEPPPITGADTSWGLMDEDVSSLLPGASQQLAAPVDFGADILGEAAPAAAAGSAPARPRAAEAPRAAEPSPLPMPSAAPRREVGARFSPTVTAPAAAPAPTPSPTPGSAPLPATPPRAPRRATGRRSKVWQFVVPLALLTVGGVTAACLQFQHQNVVISGFAGAVTLVLAAFAWIFLR